MNHDKVIDSGLNEQAKIIVNLVSDGCVVTDSAGNIAEANRAFGEICGVAPAKLRGMNLRQFIAPKTFQRVFETQSQTRTGDTKTDFKIQIQTASEKLVEIETEVGFLDASRNLICFCCRASGKTQRDQTARKLREQALLESADQIRQMQKFEALGILTGGIAHDFNNFLAVVMLHSDMLGLQLPADSVLQRRVSQIKTAAANAAETVRNLLAFSRQQMMQPRAAVLNQIIAESETVLRTLLGEQIELATDLDLNAGVCMIDPDQMKQVLVNLAANARDAMPNGGILTVQTQNVRLNRRDVRHKTQSPGDYIRLTVADTGTGMNPAIKDRVFEPFFTTKTAGDNNGLGLAAVYGIIKQSNGFIWVESEPGDGTRFVIELLQLRA